jgi:predicted metalloenzyme YecM
MVTFHKEVTDMIQKFIVTMNFPENAVVIVMDLVKIKVVNFLAIVRMPDIMMKKNVNAEMPNYVKIISEEDANVVIIVMITVMEPVVVIAFIMYGNQVGELICVVSFIDFYLIK